MSYLREYLYIDDIEINSILAQINEGLNKKTTRIIKHEEINGLNHQQSGELSGNGDIKIPLVAKAGLNVSGSVSRTSNSENSDASENAEETVYNDYGVEILENQLSEDGLLKTEDDEFMYGDFVRITAPFNLVDFSVIESVTEPKLLEEVMSMGTTDSDIQKLSSEIQKQKKRSRSNVSAEDEKNLKNQENELLEMRGRVQTAKDISNNAKSIYEFGKLGNSLFKDSVLISSDLYNSYAERNHFRFNKIQLSMLQDNPRNGTIIGIIENKVRLDSEDPFNGNIDGRALAKIDTFFLNTVLSNFGLLKDGTLLIKPLAIYFD